MRGAVRSLIDKCAYLKDHGQDIWLFYISSLPHVLLSLIPLIHIDLQQIFLSDMAAPAEKTLKDLSGKWVMACHPYPATLPRAPVPPD